MHKMRKIGAAAIASVASVGSALAEGTYTVNLTEAGNAADAVGDALSTLLTGKVMTNVLLVVGAGLALWAVFAVIRWMKKGAK